ncbi:8510_t:CDS:2 [Gigaspora margarita]|uniref:8510_t:CDS:1 n=1 Tax=Gigaspora margarita TaxID=4874 RepID=A0ABN7UTB6_GIGMA|nr:8510_t:CDS:2 [Gigaspora margarita]
MKSVFDLIQNSKIDFILNTYQSPVPTLETLAVPNLNEICTLEIS